MPKRLKRIYGFGHLHFLYVDANPLKRGLVEDLKDWPGSSYAFFQGRGEVLIEIDPVN